MGSAKGGGRSSFFIEMSLAKLPNQKSIGTGSGAGADGDLLGRVSRMDE